MKNILNVVSIFGKQIDWELDTALFWLFVIQAVLVVFMVIVFAVLLHRIGKAKSTVIVQSTAAAPAASSEPQQELPVEETPAEEEPTAQEPADEPPVEETPQEEAVEETPEEAPAEEQPAEETPEEQPTEEAPAEEQAEEQTEEEPLDDDDIELIEEVAAEETPEEAPAEETPAEDGALEEATADNTVIVAPIILPAEQQETPAPAPKRNDEEQLYLGANVRLDRSFVARIIQADDDIKSWYGDLKNYMLSFKKVHDRVSWKKESFYFGRQKVATIAFRGLTMCLYLPLKAEEISDSKYKVEPIEDNASFEDTPCLYRIKNARRIKYAKELIAMVMQNYGGEQGAREDVDYYQPYEETEALIEQGLIKRNLRSKKDEKFFKAAADTDDNN